MLSTNANEVVNIIEIVMDNMISYKYLKDMIITHPSILKGLMNCLIYKNAKD